MASFDSSSTWILLSLLGGLSLASIILTYNSEDLPGVVSREREVIDKDDMQLFRRGLRGALSSLPSLHGLCHTPQETLASLNFGPKRAVVLQDQRWIKERKFLPQNERDAWQRCQAGASEGPDQRRRLCFHFSSQSPSPQAWDSPVNIVELSLEWYGRDRKKPINCATALDTGTFEELAIYYSMYWSNAALSKGRDRWSFQRMTGGLRLAPEASARL